MNASGLVAELRRSAAGEVRDDPASRDLYASRREHLPAAARSPPCGRADADDLDAAVAACRAHGVPLTMRGAGTSLAGQAVGRGLVVDCSALATVEIDPDARIARVGPGVVLDDLNAAAARPRAHVRRRRRHRQPRDARRDDRQQLGRGPLGGPRADGRPRAARST